MPKYWIDQNGDKIPEKYVPRTDKEREEVVTECHKLVGELHEKLQEVRNQTARLVNQFLEDSAAYAELKNWKGNATLVSFDGQRRIRKEVKDRIDFDEKLQLSEQYVKKCLYKWGKSARRELKALINDAYKTDKKGNINKNDLLKLLKYNFEDDEWKTAMEYLRKSIMVVDTKAYYVFEYRNSEGEWVKIPLNFHDVPIQKSNTQEDAKTAA